MEQLDYFLLCLLSETNGRRCSMNPLQQNVTPLAGRDYRQHPGRRAAPSQVVREIVRRLFADYRGSTAVRLWDGDLVHGSRTAPVTLVVNEPEVVRELLLHPDLFRLVEAYLCGRLEVEGDFERLFELGDHLERFEPPLHQRLALLRLALSLPRPRRRRQGKPAGYRRRFRSNCRETIAHHYDLGNDFYRLWLDPEMVYSCAYFASQEQPLPDAQRDKLDYLCRKLRLKPDQQLLDIGCGWGALAIWAASHYGARVHGITLSEEQYHHARQRVREEGLQDRVHIELLDYRDLPGQDVYDRVISVGMFEHIGIRNFHRYFDTVRRVLKPGGLFLNHGITSDSDWKTTPGTRFINRYIFPDGELARISTVLGAMQASLRSRERFWDIRVPKIDSIFDNSLVPRPSWSPGVPPQHRKLVAATHRSPI